MRNGLLLTASLLFAVALLFALRSEPRLLGGITPNAPNILASAATLGFAVAGGLSLIASAVAHLGDRRP